MKRTFCDVCGKETEHVLKWEIRMPISSYEDHKVECDLCISCHRKLQNEIINKNLFGNIKEIIKNGEEYK